MQEDSRVKYSIDVRRFWVLTHGRKEGKTYSQHMKTAGSECPPSRRGRRQKVLEGPVLGVGAQVDLVGPRHG